MQVVDEHHQVARAAQPSSLAAYEAVGFQEEQPEVGEREEFLLVSEDIQVKQFRKQEFSLRSHVLELYLEHSTIIFFRVVVLGDLDIDVLVI